MSPKQEDLANPYYTIDRIQAMAERCFDYHNSGIRVSRNDLWRALQDILNAIDEHQAALKHKRTHNKQV